MRWRDLIGEVAARLGSEVDARRIAEEASGYEGAELALHLDDPVTARAAAHVDALVERRAAGEPLQYVLGRWSFRRLDLFVDRRVLIPRPETEVVAGVAIEEIRRCEPPAIAVDLGTGSGAIALSIADEVPGTEVWGTDISADSLAVARANLAGVGGYGAPKVRLVEGSWFAALPSGLRGKIDVVVSNPPYVADGEVLPAEVGAWEPRAALYAGAAGTECLAAIVEAAPPWLRRPGSLVVEIAPHQADAVRAMCAAAGFDDVAVLNDLTGRARCVRARIFGGNSPPNGGAISAKVQ